MTYSLKLIPPIKIIVINETHCSSNKPPKLKGFVTYSRERQVKRMGGVAVLIHKSLDDGAVKLDVGEGENEFVAVKVETFTPPLVVISYYGVQENQYSQEKVASNLSELMEKARNYSEQGCDVVVSGDFNVKIGNRESELYQNDALLKKVYTHNQ